MRIASWLSCGALALGACTDDSHAPPPPIEGDFYQYVVADLHLPHDNASARALSFDLDGNGSYDNTLGAIFALLDEYDLGVESTARDAIVRGNAIMLVSLQTTSFDDSAPAGFATSLGTNPTPPACTDPADVSTCGHHLATLAHYDLVDGGGSDLGRGAFDNGVYAAHVGVLPIQLGLDPEMPLRVDLHAAQVRMTDAAADHATALIGGGITPAAVQGVIIPEAARQMNRIVQTECAVTTGYPPCGCLGRADTVQRVFDTDDSCSISATELAASSLIQGLTASDVRIDGEALLSFGFAVDLVPAEF